MNTPTRDRPPPDPASSSAGGQPLSVALVLGDDRAAQEVARPLADRLAAEGMAVTVLEPTALMPAASRLLGRLGGWLGGRLAAGAAGAAGAARVAGIAGAAGVAAGLAPARDGSSPALSPQVVCAFDAEGAAAAAAARDSGRLRTPVLTVTAELCPASDFAQAHADRYAVLDESSRESLVAAGVEARRIAVTSVPCSFAAPAAEDRAALRQRLSLAAHGPVVLAELWPLAADALSPTLLQLGLTAPQATMLLDIGDDPRLAATLRRRAPAFGLRARMFSSAAPEAPSIWRGADVVIARPEAGAILRALHAGAAFLCLPPLGLAEEERAAAIVSRGLGRLARRTILLAAELAGLLGSAELVAAGRQARSMTAADAPSAIAGLLRQMGKNAEAILAEERPAVRRPDAQAVPGPVAAAAASSQAATGGRRRVCGPFEEIGGEPDDAAGVAGAAGAADVGKVQDAEEAGDAGKASDARLAQVVLAQIEARRQVEDARVQAELWQERATIAAEQGDCELARHAQRAADQHRQAMHAALGQLRRLGEQAASHRPAGQASGIGAAQAPAGVAAGSSGSAQVGSSIGDEARAGVAEEQALEQALERKLRALELDEELARLKQQMAREG